MVSHRPFPGLSDEARWDREDSIPIGGWRPGWAAGFWWAAASAAAIGRDGVSLSVPGLHLVGMVSHRPFPGLSDEAHRDREDSIPTGGWRPGWAAGFGSGELRRVALGLARLLLDANITARIPNKPPFDFIVYSTKNKRCVF